jgi:hypothetical protein
MSVCPSVSPNFIPIQPLCIILLLCYRLLSILATDANQPNSLSAQKNKANSRLWINIIKVRIIRRHKPRPPHNHPAIPTFLTSPILFPLIQDNIILLHTAITMTPPPDHKHLPQHHQLTTDIRVIHCTLQHLKSASKSRHGFQSGFFSFELFLVDCDTALPEAAETGFASLAAVQVVQHDAPA